MPPRPAVRVGACHKNESVGKTIVLAHTLFSTADVCVYCVTVSLRRRPGVNTGSAGVAFTKRTSTSVPTANGTNLTVAVLVAIMNPLGSKRPAAEVLSHTYLGIQHVRGEDGSTCPCSVIPWSRAPADSLSSTLPHAKWGHCLTRKRKGNGQREKANAKARTREHENERTRHAEKEGKRKREKDSETERGEDTVPFLPTPRAKTKTSLRPAKTYAATPARSASTTMMTGASPRLLLLPRMNFAGGAVGPAVDVGQRRVLATRACHNVGSAPCVCVCVCVCVRACVCV